MSQQAIQELFLQTRPSANGDEGMGRPAGHACRCSAGFAAARPGKRRRLNRRLIVFMPQQAIQELKTRAREQAAGRETPVNRPLTA